MVLAPSAASGVRLSVVSDRTWTIGELAAECGLTVRALRHFEDAGLLGGIGRTSGGRRVYARADVERVYRIVALRSLGLPLALIAVALESPTALEQALAAQLAQLDRQVADLTDLRPQLQRLIGRRSEEPITIEELMFMIRRTAVSQEILHEYLDDADRARLAQRSAELGPDAAHSVDVEYPRLYRAAQDQMARGVAPDAPPMQAIAGELEALAGQWRTDPADGVQTSLKVQRMWAERSEEIAGRDYTELAEYVLAARAHYRSTR
jgi:DNA-binding transcriptional MerR regulator